jgi:Putative bacterial sensory transduction regulator
VLRPHVEQTLRTYLGLEPSDTLTVDPDGDIPVRRGSALYYVSLLDHDPVLVRVWSIVLEAVEADAVADLLVELNDVNATILGARVFLASDRVIAATELRADTLDLDELADACDAIGALADWIDNTLQIRFGGRRHFRDDGDGKTNDDNG